MNESPVAPDNVHRVRHPFAAARMVPLSVPQCMASPASPYRAAGRPPTGPAWAAVFAAAPPPPQYSCGSPESCALPPTPQSRHCEPGARVVVRSTHDLGQNQAATAAPPSARPMGSEDDVAHRARGPGPGNSNRCGDQSLSIPPDEPAGDTSELLAASPATRSGNLHRITIHVSIALVRRAASSHQRHVVAMFCYLSQLSLKNGTPSRHILRARARARARRLSTRHEHAVDLRLRARLRARARKARDKPVWSRE